MPISVAAVTVQFCAQVVVRELGALRRARRARRVEDHRRVVARARLVGLGPRRGHHQLLELARLDQDRLGARRLGAPSPAASPKPCQAKTSFAPESFR